MISHLVHQCINTYSMFFNFIGVRSYKRLSDGMQEHLSNILDGSRFATVTSPDVEEVQPDASNKTTDTNILSKITTNDSNEHGSISFNNCTFNIK